MIDSAFFEQDVLQVAPALLGNNLVRRFSDGSIQKYAITEVEAYRGTDDLACHASKGRTKRTEVMFWKGGYIYVYLIYGMYNMLNFVTGSEDNPQAVLIRGIEGFDGPGKLTKHLKIDKEFNQKYLFDEGTNLWIEATQNKIVKHKTLPRVGIDYAGEVWKNMPWRFIID